MSSTTRDMKGATIIAIPAQEEDYVTDSLRTTRNGQIYPFPKMKSQLKRLQNQYQRQASQQSKKG
jgi:hypothetical protein